MVWSLRTLQPWAGRAGSEVCAGVLPCGDGAALSRRQGSALAAASLASRQLPSRHQVIVISPTPSDLERRPSGRGLLSFPCGRKQTGMHRSLSHLFTLHKWDTHAPHLLHLLPLGAAPGPVRAVPGQVFSQHPWFDQWLCILTGSVIPLPHAGVIFLYLSLQHWGGHDCSFLQRTRAPWKFDSCFP